MSTVLMLAFPVCAVFSAKWSIEAFREGNKVGGWVNLIASAINAAMTAVTFF